jgi:NADPH-dependent curcumin reductase CurA
VPERFVEPIVISEDLGDDSVIDLPALAELPGKLPDRVGRVADAIDILFDRLNGAQLEAGVSVGMAEGALVPGAISGRPDQETPRLTGRPYGSLLKAGIGVHKIVPSQHFKDNIWIDIVSVKQAY